MLQNASFLKLFLFSVYSSVRAVTLCERWIVIFDWKVVLLKSYLHRGLDERLAYPSWLVFLVLEFTR